MQFNFFQLPFSQWFNQWDNDSTPLLSQWSSWFTKH